MGETVSVIGAVPMALTALSGYLAARSFTDRLDYDMQSKRELSPMIERSRVNKFLFQFAGYHGTG